MGATGEYFRTLLIGRFGDTGWADESLLAMLGQEGLSTFFTASGLFQDHSGRGWANPLSYDTFIGLGYLPVLLREGYTGPFAPLLREIVRRGAHTRMLMQSPWGETPVGGRSSQEPWAEAAAALGWEIAASDALALGDTLSACQFKRAAALAAGSIASWQNPDGSLQVVKNRFPHERRWGWDSYAFRTNFNANTAAFLALAHLHANDTIEECASPADLGGFVFELPEFSAVIANTGGL